MKKLDRGALVLFASLGLIVPAATANDIIGITWHGHAIHVDSATGVGTLLGNSGSDEMNSMAAHPDGTLYALSRDSELFTMDPLTGLTTLVGSISGLADPRGMAFRADGMLYVIDAPVMYYGNHLYLCDIGTGSSTVLGPTYGHGIQGLAVDPTDGTIYAWDCGSGGSGGMALCTLVPSNGFAWNVNAFNLGDSSVQTLFFDGGQLYAGRGDLWMVDKHTDTHTLVGSPGYDLRGMEFIDGGGVGPGTAYCFCHQDNPVGNVPLCGNYNDGTDPLGAGCAHDDSPVGARLYGSGEASVSADTLLLAAERGPISNSAMFFQANNSKEGAGIYLGDGLRCAGGGLIRLKVKTTDAAGFADSSPMVITSRSASLGHAIVAGETLYYQMWFRDADGSPCGTENNTSNGYRVTWGP